MADQSQAASVAEEATSEQEAAGDESLVDVEATANRLT